MGHSLEDRAKAIFEAVIDLPADRRAAKVADFCHGAEDLQRLVEALIESHESAQAGGFLEVPAVERPHAFDATMVPTSVGEKPGDTIGPYKLLQVIGEGGFGVVFMAEQKEPVKRRVALKIIKHGMDTKEVIARFEAERQALAMMDHPNIARVLDGGATERGRPYFVMDLVKGVQITDFCDENKLGVRERLELFGDVCRAIQHAHQKGVIHRDLKPSNVLVTLHDGRPVPVVIDFGIAKATNTELTSKTLFTEYGQMIGTPAYMSPEQAEMSGLDVDTRSDVYSLGVLLYELLTGTTPLDVQKLRSEGFVQLLQAIRDAEPQRPSTRVTTALTATHIAERRRMNPGKLGALLRGDLDWIVMRCLEKNRARRYDSAASLAADLQRHLSGEAVEAVPPSRAYRVSKFVRRHKGPVVAAAVVAVSLILGVIGTTIGMRRAIREADRAERETARATEVKSVVKAMLTSIKPEEAQGADTTLLKGIVGRTAARLAAGEVRDPLIAAELHGVLGSTYTSIGEYDLAERHLKEASAVYERELGRDSSKAALAAMGLAMLRHQQGALREALRLQRDVLPRLRNAKGATRRNVIGAEVDLANTLYRLGENDEALALVTRVGEEARTELGEADDFTRAAMQIRALVLRSLGRTDESLAQLEALIDLKERLLGAEDLETLTERINYAGGLARVERFEDAERVIGGVYDQFLKILGPEHPKTLAARLTLAEIHLESHRDVEAEKLALEIREIAERTLRAEHGIRLGLHALLGQVYHQQGRRNEAASEILQGVESARRLLGDRDPRALAHASDATEQLMWIDRYKEAHALNLYAVGGTAEAYGPDHPRTVIARARLAASMAHVGDAAEAETLARDVIAQLEAQAKPRGRTVRYVQGSLMRAIARQGRVEEAAALMDRVTSALGDDADNAAEFLREMGELRAGWGHLAAAEPLARRAHALDARQLGPQDGRTLERLLFLAQILRLRGRPEEALTLYRQCVDGQRASLGPDHAVTIETTIQMAVLLGALKDFQEAEKLLLDAIERADRVLGRKHVVTALCYRSLGMVYMDARRLEDATRVLQIAVEVQAAVDGDPAAEDLNRLGMLAAVRSDMPAAEPLFARAVEVAERKLGTTHDTTLDCANRHADCLFRLGRFADSAERYERTLQVTEGVLPATHPRRMVAVERLLHIRTIQDRPAAKIPLLELLLQAKGGVCEGASEQVIQIVQALGLTYGAVGRDDDARTLYSRARACTDPQGASYATLRLTEGAALLNQGQWEASEAAVREARASFLRLHGAETPFVTLADLILADLALGRGQLDEALASVRALYGLLDKVAPREHQYRQYAARTLVEALHRAGRSQEAVPFIEELVLIHTPLANKEDASRDTLDVQATCLLRAVSTDTYDPKRALELASRAAYQEERYAGGRLWQRLFTVAKARLHTADATQADGTFRRALSLAPAPYREILERLWKAEVTAVQGR